MSQEPQKTESNKESFSDDEKITVEDVLRPQIDRFLSKIYSILSWCWPATILMFIGREVLRQFGYYGISNWAVTVFLWLPFAIVIGATSLFIGFFYIISLVAAWKNFIDSVFFHFRIGFNAATTQEKEEK